MLTTDPGTQSSLGTLSIVADARAVEAERKRVEALRRTTHPGSDFFKVCSK